MPKRKKVKSPVVDESNYYAARYIMGQHQQQQQQKKHAFDNLQMKYMTHKIQSELGGGGSPTPSLFL
jgi:hypothetical protein